MSSCVLWDDFFLYFCTSYELLKQVWTWNIWNRNISFNLTMNQAPMTHFVVEAIKISLASDVIGKLLPRGITETGAIKSAHLANWWWMTSLKRKPGVILKKIAGKTVKHERKRTHEWLGFSLMFAEFESKALTCCTCCLKQFYVSFTFSSFPVCEALKGEPHF